MQNKLTIDNLYVGALSGTSVDAIDTVVADLSHNKIAIIAQHTEPLPLEIKQAVWKLQKSPITIAELAQLDSEIGNRFALAINQLLKEASLSANQIHAIGLHGQTIMHQPLADPAFTLQIGNPNIVALQTNCTTVADFRRADMAAGGQGAPLTCAFHAKVFSAANETRVIINIGGISNITILAVGKHPAGFDCGPGNTLLDYWAQQHLNKRYDKNGDWAASARYDKNLLKKLLDDKFIQLAPPKSACTSYFDSTWLEEKLMSSELDPAVVQVTLTEFTTACIAQAIQTYAKDTKKVFVCGGGAKNDYLIGRLRTRINQQTDDTTVTTTDVLGVPTDWVEALAFAWLAQRRLENKTANLPAITGARRKVVLGAIYEGSTE